MAEWPEVNDRVVLIRADGESSASRVEDDANGLLAIADPVGEAWEGEPDVGGDYELQWPSPRGVWSMPVLLRRTEQGSVPVWWVEPVDEPTLDQRRNHVRAAAAGATVEVTWTGSAREAQRGTVADLSEGGTRVLLPTWVPAEAGEQVGCRIEAGSTVLDLAGEVLRASHPRATTELVITFEELSEAVGSQVRQLVFAWQRLGRR